ncbi:hypothetical protein GGS21DRAFT_546596 [Xylaria nigripes]|nr:hypothetical protein GGS21DRAFT_546596 [Xylaria nigripes]
MATTTEQTNLQVEAIMDLIKVAEDITSAQNIGDEINPSAYDTSNDPLLSLDLESLDATTRSRLEKIEATQEVTSGDSDEINDLIDKFLLHYINDDEPCTEYVSPKPLKKGRRVAFSDTGSTKTVEYKRKWDGEADDEQSKKRAIPSTYSGMLGDDRDTAMTESMFDGRSTRATVGGAHSTITVDSRRPFPSAASLDAALISNESN